jgi:shikimate dehydrogenase
VAGLRALGFLGANVTVPHKEALLPLLDEVDTLAQRVGAVNTIVAREGRLRGTNTDVPGFLAALRTLWGRSPAGSRCLVMGAGGAGRAVVAGLVSAAAEVVHVYNRTPERAVALCREAATWGETACRPVLWEDLGGVAADVDLLVNATSVGLGDVKVASLPVDIVNARHVVMDLVYGGGPTAFVAEAAERGARAMDGREMLLQQAVVSYELWTGRTAPIDVMREALLRG